MKLFLAIDDTDDLESEGTGHLAEAIGQDIVAAGWGTRTYITRHQLLVHPDVPYTSHNSSMCFAAEVPEAHLEAVTAHAVRVLETRAASSSDPGLCVAPADLVTGREELLEYGRRAKREVLKKAEAHQLARRLGVHLSEHGGTGGGVIGALAAVGLRLTGNDGRVKGKLLVDRAGQVVTAGELLRQPSVEAVTTLDGVPLGAGEEIVLGQKVKAVFLAGRATVLVVPSEGERPAARWRTCPEEIVKRH